MRRRRHPALPAEHPPSRPRGPVPPRAPRASPSCRWQSAAGRPASRTRRLSSWPRGSQPLPRAPAPGARCLLKQDLTLLSGCVFFCLRGGRKELIAIVIRRGEERGRVAEGEAEALEEFFFFLRKPTPPSPRPVQSLL